ncbi:hypothetical protein BC831DRAFT_23811 [Entophlyctis helioformis]|nr:hypothetical protein BC831DRAFT_23811 [Entophlyctis helioformis]
MYSHLTSKDIGREPIDKRTGIQPILDTFDSKLINKLVSDLTDEERTIILNQLRSNVTTGTARKIATKGLPKVMVTELKLLKMRLAEQGLDAVLRSVVMEESAHGLDLQQDSVLCKVLDAQGEPMDSDSIKISHRVRTISWSYIRGWLTDFINFGNMPVGEFILCYTRFFVGVKNFLYNKNALMYIGKGKSKSDEAVDEDFEEQDIAEGDAMPGSSAITPRRRGRPSKASMAPAVGIDMHANTLMGGISNLPSEVTGAAAAAMAAAAAAAAVAASAEEQMPKNKRRRAVKVEGVDQSGSE